METNYNYINKRWHSPLQAYEKLLQKVQEIGIRHINREDKYKKVRETRIAMIVSLILSKTHGSPTFLRIPKRKDEPPDAYLMHPSPINHGYFRGVALEIIEYYGYDKNLLEQLQETKMCDTYKKSSRISLLVAEIHTLKGVDYCDIDDYLKKNKTPFPVWTIYPHSDNLDTTVEVVKIGTDSKHFQVIIDEEAYRKIYAEVHAILIMKRTGRPDRSHIEDSYSSLYHIASREQLED